MKDQEIIDNADLPDWTHHNDDIDSDVACFHSYIKQVEGINGQEFYNLGFDGKRKIWKRCNGIYNTTRSRIDIERIVELESYNLGLASESCKQQAKIIKLKQELNKAKAKIKNQKTEITNLNAALKEPKS